MSSKPFRVLSLDGGGMRGIYTASVLSTLANCFDKNKIYDIGKGFDLIVGTSTGSIIATALVVGVPIQKIIDFYRKKGPSIFKNRIPLGMFKKIMWSICRFNSAANSNVQLINALTEIFKDETVGEVYKRRQIGLCLPSVKMTTYKPVVFKTAHNPDKSADDSRKLTEICLASSAAPMIFPIAEIRDVQTVDSFSYFTDGGLWANNPVLIGLIEALSLSKQNQSIEIISIGTCHPFLGSALTGKETNRGIFGWHFGIKALELSMDAQAKGHHFIANLLKEYFKENGKQITILRLDQSFPSSDQISHLGIDNATKKTQSILIQLGNDDALAIYSKVKAGNSEYKILEEIFKQMPELKEQV